MSRTSTQFDLDRFVRNNVQCCMSHVVATLAQGCGTTNIASLAELCEQAMELASPVDDCEEAAIQKNWHVEQDGTWFRAPLTDDEAPMRVTAATAQEACEMDSLEPYEREVFEFWAVDSWFAEKLIAQGEKVDTDFAGLCVWARTTSGQAISMDGVIERIWRDLHKDDA